MTMKNLTNAPHQSNDKKPTALENMLDNKKSMGESTNKKKARRGTKKEGDKIILPFPISLHDLLNDAEQNGKDDIVSFFPNGKAFSILKPKEFTEELMPLYFKTKKIASFQRQLLLYGFKRIVQEDTKMAGYYHEFFIKGQKVLSLNITRQRQLTSSSQSTSNPALERNPSIRRQQQPSVPPNNAPASNAVVSLDPTAAADAARAPSFGTSLLNMWPFLPSNLMQPTGLPNAHPPLESSNLPQAFGDSPLTNIYLQAALALQQQKMTMMAPPPPPVASSDMTDERMLVNMAVARAQFQERQRVEQAANDAATGKAAALKSEAETQAAETLANIFSNTASWSQRHTDEETQHVESV